jgi:hypothetical protein
VIYQPVLDQRSLNTTLRTLRNWYIDLIDRMTRHAIYDMKQATRLDVKVGRSGGNNAHKMWIEVLVASGTVSKCLSEGGYRLMRGWFEDRVDAVGRGE